MSTSSNIGEQVEVEGSGSDSSSKKSPVLERTGSSLGSIGEQMQETHMMMTMTSEHAQLQANPHQQQHHDVKMKVDDGPSITLIAKFGKERITLDGLSPDTTIARVKEMLQEHTRVLPKRQKLVGLTAEVGGAKAVTETLTLSALKKPTKGLGKSSTASANAAASTQASASKAAAATAMEEAVITHQFILMGTPEEEIFVDPADRDDLPDVIDDFDLDFNAGSDEWQQHVANGENLKKFTNRTAVHIMNPPRDGKPLLVLDLDHTLLDFSSKTLLNASAGVGGPAALPIQGVAEVMKRPYMDQFLSVCYQHYDLVVWSQTSWRWLETKLIELGMLTHPGYKFCFVLDKTSMFTITSTKRDGTSITHHVKPLQLIWSKFPDRWNSHNTVHIDDLSRNFALNLSSGLKIKAYYRKRSAARQDAELLGLSKYLQDLALSKANFDLVDFQYWTDVVTGKRPLIDPDTAAAGASNDGENGVKKKP